MLSIIVFIAWCVTALVAGGLALYFILRFTSLSNDAAATLVLICMFTVLVLFPLIAREKVVLKREEVININSISKIDEGLIIGAKNEKDPTSLTYFILLQTDDETHYVLHNTNEVYELECINKQTMPLLVRDKEIQYYRWRICGGIDSGNSELKNVGGKIKISKSLKDSLWENY